MGHPPRLGASILLLLIVPCSAYLHSVNVVQREQIGRAVVLKLELATNKKRYKVGEAVLVTVTLRNEGEEAVLLYPALLTFFGAGANTAIEVADAEENLVRRRPRPGDVVGEPAPIKTPLHESILSTHRVFSPGDFRGFTRSLRQLGFELDKPGRYRLRAKYREHSYKEWVAEKDFEEARKKLPFVWWGEAESDWVWIEIRP